MKKRLYVWQYVTYALDIGEYIYIYISIKINLSIYVYIQVEPGKPGAEVSKGKKHPPSNYEGLPMLQILEI